MVGSLSSLSLKWKVILPVAIIMAASAAATVCAAGAGRLRDVIALQVAALLLVALTIAIVIHRTVVARMARLMHTMGEVERGDLSARVRGRSHDEIGRMRERFSHMVEQIEASNAALVYTQRQLAQSEKLASIGLLAAGVAHEINNPLATISVAAESLLEGAAGDRERELARAVSAQAARISDIIRQLLSFDYSRPLDLAPGDVRDVLEETLAGVHTGEVRVLRRYEPPVPKVLLDPDKLREAFGNIVRNALDAMAGSGELTAAVSQRGDRVEVAISDTGPGIPRERLSRIFDPFFTTKEVGEGTGLGLTIAYQFVKMHHGEMEVTDSAGGESPNGRGARVVVRLPVAPEASDEPGH